MNESTFTEYLQGKNLAAATIKIYLEHLEHFQDWLDQSGKTMLEVAYPSLLEYIQYLRSKGWKGRSINGALGAIRHQFNYLQKQGKISDNPAAGLFVRDTTNRLPHDLLSTKELHELYENYPQKTAVQVTRRQLLGFFVFQGIRSAEAAATD